MVAKDSVDMRQEALILYFGRGETKTQERGSLTHYSLFSSGCAPCQAHIVCHTRLFYSSVDA